MKWQSIGLAIRGLVDESGEILAEVSAGYPLGVWIFGFRRFTSREAAERAAEAAVAKRQRDLP